MPSLPAYIPFPSPLRIGTDICQVHRIYRLLRGRFAYPFAKRILRKEELGEEEGKGERGFQSVLERWREVDRERGLRGARRVGRGGERMGYGEREIRESDKQRGEGRGQGSIMGYWRRDGARDGSAEREALEGSLAREASGPDTSLLLKAQKERQKKIEEVLEEIYGHSPPNWEMCDLFRAMEGSREKKMGLVAEDSEMMSSEEEMGGRVAERAEEREKKLQEKSMEQLDQEMEKSDEALQGAARWLAGRFAAKEATMKAHTSRRLTYHSILILKPPPKEGVEGSVAPVVLVMDDIDGTGTNTTRTMEEPAEAGKMGLTKVERGRMMIEEMMEGKGMKRRREGVLEEQRVRGKEVRVSISHDGNYATAVCLAVDE